MKKFITLYLIPVLLQILLVPFWYKTSSKYIDASIISIAICIMTPLYLLIINLSFRWYRYKLLKLHLGMLVIIVLTVFFNHIGWAMLSYKFFRPDPMTKSIQIFFLEWGILVVGVSFLISILVKRIKNHKN